MTCMWRGRETHMTPSLYLDCCLPVFTPTVSTRTHEGVASHNSLSCKETGSCTLSDHNMHAPGRYTARQQSRNSAAVLSQEFEEKQTVSCFVSYLCVLKQDTKDVPVVVPVQHHLVALQDTHTNSRPQTTHRTLLVTVPACPSLHAPRRGPAVTCAGGALPVCTGSAEPRGRNAGRSSMDTACKETHRRLCCKLQLMLDVQHSLLYLMTHCRRCQQALAVLNGKLLIDVQLSLRHSSSSSGS